MADYFQHLKHGLILVIVFNTALLPYSIVLGLIKFDGISLQISVLIFISVFISPLWTLAIVNHPWLISIQKKYKPNKTDRGSVRL